MKKFLCLMLAFVLCISMCAAAEENAGEEAVSNIVTYGPVSFDISDKWVEYSNDSGYYWEDAMLTAIDNEDVYFWFFVKDIWNYELTEEIRKEYELLGYYQEDFDFIQIAEQLLKSDALNSGWEVDIDTLEILKIGQYDFCRLIPKSLENFHGHIILNPTAYYAVINGYGIMVVSFAPSNSVYHERFLEMLNTMIVKTTDFFPQND